MQNVNKRMFLPKKNKHYSYKTFRTLSAIFIDFSSTQTRSFPKTITKLLSSLRQHYCLLFQKLTSPSHCSVGHQWQEIQTTANQFTRALRAQSALWVRPHVPGTIQSLTNISMRDLSSLKRRPTGHDMKHDIHVHHNADLRKQTQSVCKHNRSS